MRRATFAFMVAIAALVVGVSPTLADTSRLERGHLGAHHLVDSWDETGTTCTLRLQLNDWWVLDRIAVNPPVMKGTRAAQEVAWRFVVIRGRIGSNNPVDPQYTVTYRSPRQIGVASVGKTATFSPMSVGVNVPGPFPGGNWYSYSVRVHMFWYKPNGKLDGKSVHDFDLHREVPPDDIFLGGECDTSRGPTSA